MFQKGRFEEVSPPSMFWRHLTRTILNLITLKSVQFGRIKIFLIHSVVFQLKNTKYKIELTHMELHVDKIIFKIFLCACGLLKNENSTIIP